MIIALHNIAVEYEYLKQYQSALLTYQKARDFANKLLGPTHMFSVKMEKVLEESASKIKGIIDRQSKRLSQKYPTLHSSSNKPVVSQAKSQPNKSLMQSSINTVFDRPDEATDLTQLLESGLSLD